MVYQLDILEAQLSDLLYEYFTQIQITNPTPFTIKHQKKIDVIILSYALADLQDEIWKRTSMRTKFIIDQKGISQTERLAMSTNEQLLFNSLSKDSANEVFKYLTGLTHKTQYAFLYDQIAPVPNYIPGNAYVFGSFVMFTDNIIYMCIQNTMAAPSDPNASAFWVNANWLNSTGKITYIIEQPRHFNQNFLSTLDNNTWLSLQKFVLKEWWKTTGLGQDYVIAEKDWEDAITSVKSSFLNTTRPLIRRPSM
jgi:hypothetical protein